MIINHKLTITQAYQEIWRKVDNLIDQALEIQEKIIKS
jgi:hypothetical protein